MDVIMSVAVVVLVVVAFLAIMVVRMHRTQVRTGAEGLVHERGVARSALGPKGKVFVHGEIWNAVADGAIDAGQAIEVVGVDGLTLRVRPDRTAPPATEGRAI
jgi:membrane-bound serine protease (ClpP class)